MSMKFVLYTDMIKEKPAIGTIAEVFQNNTNYIYTPDGWISINSYSELAVRIKKTHPEAVVPSYAKPGDAGVDITTISDPEISQEGFISYKTGLSIAIPDKHVGLIFPRSSVSKYDLDLCNAVAVIDNQFRGEITLRFNPLALPEEAVMYKKGDKIGQLIIMPFPKINFIEVDQLEETERGQGGFGSTGS